MDGRRSKIVLVPIGVVDAQLVDHLARGLAVAFLSPVSIRAALPIPPGSHDPERRQYLSPVFLAAAETARQDPREMILGITDVDLYVPDLNFVFGQASPADRAAVVSVFRLGTGGVDLLLGRALKEAVHELGHVLGLPHCRDPGCVMFFSNSLADTDRKSEAFCNRCKGRLEGSFG